MKKVKKFFATVMAVAMAVSMMVPAMAAGETGSITINGISTDVKYAVYLMLDLKDYKPGTTIDPITGEAVGGQYSYKVNTAWAGFFVEKSGDKNDALDYMTINENEYVEWKTSVSSDETTVAEFAKLALKWAEENGVAPVKVTADMTVSGDKGVFSNLPLGYYLVDTSMGALCGLTTTNPDASLNAKNGRPTIDKQVQEDSLAGSANGGWGNTNTADIGQIVKYEVTIEIKPGAEDLVLHDVMDNGLTFKGVTEILHIVPPSKTGTPVNNSYFEIWTGDGVTVGNEKKSDGVTPLYMPSDGTITGSEGCTFEVRFNEAFSEHVKPNDKVVIQYEAMLNRNAVVAGAGNTNKAKLEYGDEHYTTEESTVTYSYGIDLIKTDGENVLIDGAKFKIYDAATGGNEVAVVYADGHTDTNPKYRRARADETGTVIIVKNGQVRIDGFDNGTYYLEETEAPDGYNVLKGRKEFIISGANHDATFNDGIYSVGSGIQVVNRAGTMLPETGGIGTTIFYVVGGLLVVGAGVLLVTKKRMDD